MSQERSRRRPPRRRRLRPGPARGPRVCVGGGRPLLGSRVPPRCHLERILPARGSLWMLSLLKLRSRFRSYRSFQGPPQRTSPALPGRRTRGARAPKAPSAAPPLLPVRRARRVFWRASTGRAPDGWVAPLTVRPSFPVSPQPLCEYLASVFIVRGPLSLYLKPPVPLPPCGLHGAAPLPPRGPWMLVSRNVTRKPRLRRWLETVPLELGRLLEVSLP